MTKRGFPAIFRVTPKTAVFLSCGIFLLTTAGLNAQTNPAALPETPAPNPTDLAVNPAKLVVINDNKPEVNVITFKRTEYVGQCPGTRYSPSKGRFASAKTPPAPNRRVIVTNVTSGMDSDPYPYTNRNYDKGELSEDFSFQLGSEHRTRTFSVLEGENKFTYQIKEGDRVLEEGSLTAQVSIENVGVFPRQEVCTQEWKCEPSQPGYFDKKGRWHEGKQGTCRTLQKCSCSG